MFQSVKNNKPTNQEKHQKQKAQINQSHPQTKKLPKPQQTQKPLNYFTF